jgi:hypothetical protein
LPQRHWVRDHQCSRRHGAVYAHRLTAISAGERQLLDRITQKSAPLIALGLQDALEIDKRRRQWELG